MCPFLGLCYFPLSRYRRLILAVCGVRGRNGVLPATPDDSYRAVGLGSGGRYLRWRRHSRTTLAVRLAGCACSVTIIIDNNYILNKLFTFHSALSRLQFRYGYTTMSISVL